MIYLSNDGRIIDTDNLLDLGLSGNPLSPTVEQKPIEIPKINTQVVAEPVAKETVPVQATAPKAEAVVGQPPAPPTPPEPQQATQPVAQPTPGTLAYLIQSPEFVQSNRADQREMLKEWHADAMGKIYTSPLSNSQKDQIGMALNTAIERLYPALERNTLADTWTSIKGGWTQGTGSGAGGLAFTFDKLGSQEWDKALLQYGIEKQQEAQKTFDTEYSAGAKDDQRAAKARDDAANKAWNEAKGFFDSISAALDVGKAKLDNFLDAPIQSTMRTAASLGPQVAATTVGAGVGAVAGSLAGPAGTAVGANIGARTVGAAMSAGEAVSQQYQQNLDYLRNQNATEKKGWTEQQMQDMAAEAALKFGADDVLALTGGALAGQVAGKAVAPVTNMVTRGLSGTAASKASGGIMSTLGRAAGDAVLEGADEVSTTIAGNIGTIDPNVKWSDDTAQAFFSGVGPGFGLGLIGNRPGGHTTTSSTPPTNQQPPAPPTAVQPESPFPPTPPAPTVVDNGQPPAPPAPSETNDGQPPTPPAPPTPEPVVQGTSQPERVEETEPADQPTPVVQPEPVAQPEATQPEPVQYPPVEVYQAELDFGDRTETASDQPVDPEYETTTEDLDAIVTAPQVEASNGTDQPTTDVQRTQADTDGGSSSVPVTQPESTQGGNGPYEPTTDATSTGVGASVQSEVAVQQRQGTNQGQPVTAPTTSVDTATPTTGGVTNEQPVNPEPASPASSQSASKRSTATPTTGGTGGDGKQGANSQRTQEPSQIEESQPTGKPEIYTPEVAQAKVDKAQRAYDNAVEQVDRYQQLVDNAKANIEQAKQGSRKYRSAANSLKTNEAHLAKALQALVDKEQDLTNVKRNLEASNANAEQKAQEQAKKDQEYREREKQRAEAKQAKRQENSEKYRQINAEQQAEKEAQWQEAKEKKQAEKEAKAKKAEAEANAKKAEAKKPKKNGAKQSKPVEATQSTEDLDDVLSAEEQAALQDEIEAELSGEPVVRNGSKESREQEAINAKREAEQRVRDYQGEHGEQILNRLAKDGADKFKYSISSNAADITHLAPKFEENGKVTHHKALHPDVINSVRSVAPRLQINQLKTYQEQLNAIGAHMLSKQVPKVDKSNTVKQNVSADMARKSMEAILNTPGHPLYDGVEMAALMSLYYNIPHTNSHAFTRNYSIRKSDNALESFTKGSVDEALDWVAHVHSSFFTKFPLEVQTKVIELLRNAGISPANYTVDASAWGLVTDVGEIDDKVATFEKVKKNAQKEADVDAAVQDFLGEIISPEVIPYVIARGEADLDRKNNNISKIDRDNVALKATADYLIASGETYNGVDLTDAGVQRVTEHIISQVAPHILDADTLDSLHTVMHMDIDAANAADARADAGVALEKLGDEFAEQEGIELPEAQGSRTAQAPETSVSSVADIRSALTADMRDTFDARLELGRNGERGGVVVVKSEHDLPIGGQDITGEGGVIQGAYDKTTGITYLVQDNLTPEVVTGVYLHEAFHAMDNPVMERRANDLLNSEVESDSELGQFMRDVEDAMVEAGVAGNVAEAGPYMIELAARRGRVQGFSAVDGKFMSWLDSWAPNVVTNMIRNAVAKMRAWRLAHGADFTPTVDDLVAYARRAAKRQAGTVVPPAIQGTINKAVAMVQRGSTKPTVTHADFSRIAQGKAPERHKHTLSSSVGSLTRFIGRKFIDRLDPLKSVNQGLHTLLEGGETLRNELLSGIYRGYMVPFHKASATAAEQLRKLAKQGKIDPSYRHIDAADVQRMAGHYAVWKYAAQANISRANFWRNVLERDIPRAIDEILADHPELAAWGRERLSEFTETEKAALKKLLGDREFEDTVEMSTLREAILPKLKSRKATQARHDLSRIATRRGELRDQLSIFEAMDGKVIEDDADGSATDKLREGRYKPIGGYTTATANKLVAEFEARPEFAVIKETYDRMMDLRRHVTELADAYGVYSDEDRAARDGLDTYVPTTGDPDKAIQQEDAERHADLRDEWYNAQENEMSYGIGMNNRNLYRERQGRTTVPDSADKAIVDQMYLTVNQIAYKAFKDEAVAVGLDAVDPEVANKLRDGTLTGEELSRAMRQSGFIPEATEEATPEAEALDLNPEAEAEGEADQVAQPEPPQTPTEADVFVFDDTDSTKSDEYTIRHMVNVRDASGNTYRVKVGFKFANRQVSESIRSGAVPSAGPLKAMNAVTRFMSSLITVKDYTFPITALARDISERTGLLASRHDLKDTNGNTVDVRYMRDVGNVLKFIRTRLAFATPTQRKNNAVWQAAFHKVYLDNEDGRFLKEMAMHYKGSGLSTQAGIVSNAVNSRTPMSNRYTTKTKRAIAEVSDALTGWAEFMGMQVSFALYRMLRERGVSVADATEAIRNTMPYGRRGEWTNSLRPLFFFLNPSLQGANLTAKSLLADYTNFNRAMKTGAPIRLAIKVASKAHTVVMLNMVASFLWSAIAGMLAGSDDEDDILDNHYERMPISTRMRNLMVPLPGGGFANVPQGYGLPGIGWGAGQILYSAAFGKMNAQDAGDEMSKLLIKELSGLPLSDVSVKDDPVGFITRTMLPSAFGGFIDAYSGKNRFGHNINNEFISKDLPRYMQGKASTPEFYKGLAEMISPVMDLTPEQTRALINGIFPGIFDRVVRSTDKADEHPVYGALGAVGLSRFMTPESKPNAVNAAYYQARSKAERLYQQLNARMPYLFKETEPIGSIYGRALRAGFTPDEATLMAMNVAIKRRMRSASTEQDDFLKTQFLRSIPR